MQTPLHPRRRDQRCLTARHQGLTRTRADIRNAIKMVKRCGRPCSRWVPKPGWNTPNAYAEWCIWKFSDDLIPSPEAWEAQPVYRKATAAGHVLPFIWLISEEKSDSRSSSRLSERVEVLTRPALAIFKEWSRKPSIFGHYSRPGGQFQSAIDYFQSDECPRKATGGWLIGGDLPKPYYKTPHLIA
jgi:hypothetical protein